MRYLLPSVLLTAILSAEAGAATVSFTHSADFFAALGATPSFTETYEGFAINSLIPDGTTLNDITYASFPAGTDGRIDDAFNRIGTRSLALERDGDIATPDFFFPGDSMSVSFANPVVGVGIFFNAGPTQAVGDLFITTPVGTADTGGPVVNYDVSTLFFAGLISDTPFTTATIGSRQVGPSTGFNLDNLTFATAARVPEPATLLLLVSGLVCFVATRLRRLDRRTAI